MGYWSYVFTEKLLAIIDKLNGFVAMKKTNKKNIAPQ